MTHPSPAEKPYKRYHCQDANMWKFKGEDGKDVPGMYEANQHAAARTELALNSAHAAGLATAEAELAALRETLVGVIKEADRETDAFIFARKVLARSETAP